MSALDILGKVNADGEVGYAEPKLATPATEKDADDVDECLDRGWLIYYGDASIGGHRDPLGREYQRRTIYRITAAGRAALEGSTS